MDLLELKKKVKCKGWLEKHSAQELRFFFFFFLALRIFGYTGKWVDLCRMNLYLALIGDWFLLFVGRFTQSLGQSETDQGVFFWSGYCVPELTFQWPSHVCLTLPPCLILTLPSQQACSLIPISPNCFCWELSFQSRVFEGHIQTIAAMTHLVFICVASSKNIVSRPIEKSLERLLHFYIFCLIRQW